MTTFIKNTNQATKAINTNLALAMAFNTASEQAGLCGALFSAAGNNKAFKAVVIEKLKDNGYFLPKSKTTDSKREAALRLAMALVYNDYMAGNKALIAGAKLAGKQYNIKGEALAELTSKATEKTRSNFSYFRNKVLAKEIGLIVSFSKSGDGKITLKEYKAPKPTAKKGARTPDTKTDTKTETSTNENKPETSAPQKPALESKATLAHKFCDIAGNDVAVIASLLVTELAKHSVEPMALLTELAKHLPETIELVNKIEFKKAAPQGKKAPVTKREKKVQAAISNATSKVA